MTRPGLSDEEGAAIVGEARRAVAEHLGAPGSAGSGSIPGEYGVFVTITRSGELRGCIGFVSPTGPLLDSVREAAVYAATQDGRFAPISAGELGGVTFEVTVLSAPERLSTDRAAYPSEITVGRHGLIVDDGQNTGLLLPQVPAEFGWDAKEFLDHTCEKAGLAAGCWMDEGVAVSRFLGTVFRETEPGGAVVRD